MTNSDIIHMFDVHPVAFTVCFVVLAISVAACFLFVTHKLLS